jgi:hypothetical protein
MAHRFLQRPLHTEHFRMLQDVSQPLIGKQFRTGMRILLDECVARLMSTDVIEARLQRLVNTRSIPCGVAQAGMI